MPTSRHCTGCGLIKLLSEFSVAPRGKYGRKARCKACDAAYFQTKHVPAIVDEDAKQQRYTKHQTGLKKCTTCGIEKERSEFSKSKDGKYGPVLMSCCKECARVRALKWFHDNRARALVNQRRRNMVQTYGITVEEYNALAEAQNHRCAVCGQSETVVKNGKVQSLSVDHCHDTGLIRGLLCNNCNRAIGLLNDDADTLRRAIGYLERG